MASTRNKNTPGDYKLETLQNSNMIDYHTNQSYGIPQNTYFSGDGLLHGRVASENLSSNSCDIESMLRGIGSTNLETPLPIIQPDITNMKSLSIIDRIPVYLPRDLVVDTNQRPHHE